MHAIKTPAFFRPSSRPSSPAPTASPTRSDPTERPSRQLNKLSLGSFRRPSPTPRPSLSQIPLTLVQDGSYLETLSLKLSEAISKALAQATGPAMANEQLDGRRPIPAGRGHVVIQLIASELKATEDNIYLHRAIFRCLHRPLSVLLTNLSTNLLPLLSSPAFHSQLVPTPQYPNPNPTQLHALGISFLAGEVLEGFDKLSLGLDGDARGDGLKVIREGLASVVTRVVNPLIGGIKNELIPILEALERPSTNNNVKTTAGTKSVTNLHPSIVTLQSVMPLYAKAIIRYTPTPASQASLAPFLISVIWRGLVALSHRPYVSPPPSPALTAVNHIVNGSSTTPPPTPPTTRFAIKLPPSRPPSPPSLQLPSTAADARALFDLLNLLPRPAADHKATKLAREAVDDAFDGLKALPALLEAVQPVQNAKGRLGNVEVSENQLEALTSDIPTLIALPILLQSQVLFGRSETGSGQPVSSMIGLSEEDYRKGCLSGFGRAEECAAAVCQQVTEVLRSMDVPRVLLGWLEAEMDDEH